MRGGAKFCPLRGRGKPELTAPDVVANEVSITTSWQRNSGRIPDQARVQNEHRERPAVGINQCERLCASGRKKCRIRFPLLGFASVFQKEWFLRRISEGCAQALGVKAVPKRLSCLVSKLKMGYGTSSALSQDI